MSDIQIKWRWISVRQTSTVMYVCCQLYLFGDSKAFKYCESVSRLFSITTVGEVQPTIERWIQSELKIYKASI